MAMELGELKMSFEELEVIIEKLETRLKYHETKAQNITMGYLFLTFGILQTSNSSSLKCTHSWVVSALTLSCSVVYFLFFCEAFVSLYRARCEMDKLCKQRAKISQHIQAARDRIHAEAMEAGDSSDGFHFNFNFHVNYDSYTIFNTKLYIVSTICALLAVAALGLIASNYKICN